MVGVSAGLTEGVSVVVQHDHDMLAAGNHWYGLKCGMCLL
jgi:hypothetical protein